MKQLIGKVPLRITLLDNEINFIMSDNTRWRLYHQQDCCEDVFINDIAGDLNDLLWREIMVSHERTQDDPNAPESGTWSFYTIGNMAHTVTIRFYGASNGYYCETATLEQTQ